MQVLLANCSDILVIDKIDQFIKISTWFGLYKCFREAFLLSQTFKKANVFHHPLQAEYLHFTLNWAST